MRLIDADELITIKTFVGDDYVEKDMTVLDFIGKYTKKGTVSIIDPVRHGYWQIARDVNGVPYWKCSFCNSDGIVGYPYCSWCGAKIDEDGDTK